MHQLIYQQENTGSSTEQVDDEQTLLIPKTASKRDYERFCLYFFFFPVSFPFPILSLHPSLELLTSLYVLTVLYSMSLPSPLRPGCFHLSILKGLFFISGLRGLMGSANRSSSSDLSGCSGGASPLMAASSETGA